MLGAARSFLAMSGCAFALLTVGRWNKKAFSKEKAL
jgi:hypothetical protein